jgi:cytochrome c553
MNNTQPHPVTLSMQALLLTCSLLFGDSVRAATADDTTHHSARHATRLAFEVCGTCHGAKGISELPKIPHLAGQDPDYLSAQLKAFRNQTRGDPDAVGYMWGMAAALDDETISALALQYAARPASAGQVSTPSLLPAGRTLYQEGLPDLGVPACSACHGIDAHGMAGFPRLAGQHAQYLIKQLRSFQNNMRDVAVMHGVAQGLKVKEMESVAAYIESLR